MKISVVLPAHNEEKYIGKCLESLLNQDYHDSEIVICLNLCTDGTEKVVESFRSDSRELVINNALTGVTPKIRIIKENRKGVTFARQTGTSAAQGEIIASADADTQYPKDWLSKIAGVFRGNPPLTPPFPKEENRIVGVYGPVYLYDGSFFVRAMARIFYLPFIYLSKLFGHDNPAGMNFAFKKEIFDKIGGYNLKLKSAEDVELSQRLKKYGKLKIISNLKVYSSARRFRLGFFQFFLHHAKNYFRVFFLKKEPKDFEDVR